MEVEDIVASCLERDEPEWSSAIEEACGRHPEHAREIREVFRAIARVESVTPGGSNAPALTIPDRLGDFRLLECLGSGGMGVVYRAVQESLGRQVALKLVRPEHLFFPAAHTRFQREVQAIANLSHTGIVPIYAVGVEGVLPYFAMELIDGCTLDEVIQMVRHRDPATLSGADLKAAIKQASKSGPDGEESTTSAGVFDGSWVDAACRLMRQAASALEHAHGRGVLHRDIKPSNLMVTRHGRVLLVDFGLASMRGTTKLTKTESQLGSYPYMSPEHLLNRDVDQRADIYSLGVSFYELLTLCSPFLSPTPEEIRRRVLAAEYQSITQLNPSVSRDAETVCLSAMSLDRDRRYHTAADFDRDLGNLLANRDVEARRVTLFERVLRITRRRPSLVAAGVLALILFLIVPTFFVFQQNRHLQELRLLADERNRKAESARVASERSRRMFEFIKDLFVTGDPGLSILEGPDTTVREVIDEGARLLRDEAGLNSEPEVQASLFDVLGRVYASIGVFDRAEELLNRAFEERTRRLSPGHPDLAESLFAKAWLDDLRGRPDRAITGYETALAILAAGPGDDEIEFAIRRGLCVSILQTPRSAEVDQVLEQAEGLGLRLYGKGSAEISIFPILRARRLRARSMYAAAEDVLRDALKVTREKLGDEHPALINLDNDWADMLLSAGRFEDALTKTQQTIEREIRRFGPDHLTVARSHQRLSHILLNLGRHEEASAAARQATSIIESSIGRDNVRYAAALGNYGEFLLVLGRAGEAAEVLSEAVRIWRKVQGQPDGLATLLLYEAGIRLSEGRLESAQGLAAEAESLMPKEFGDRTNNRATLRMVQSSLALMRQDREKAQALISEAVDIFTEVVGPGHHRTATARNQLGECLLMAGRHEEALLHFRSALGIFESVYGPSALLTADARCRLARALYPLGDLAGAEKELSAALDVYARYALIDSANPGLVGAKITLSTVFYHQARFAECLSLAESTLDDVRRLFASDVLRVANFEMNVLDARRETGALDGLVEEVVRVRDHLAALSDDSAHKVLLGARIEVTLARIHGALGNHVAQEEHARRAMNFLRRILPGDHTMVGEAEGEIGIALEGLGKADDAEEMLLDGLEKINAVGLTRRTKSRMIEALIRVYDRMGLRGEMERWRKLQVAENSY